MLDPQNTESGRQMTQEEIDRYKAGNDLANGEITIEQFIDDILNRGSGDEKIKLTPKRREGAITAINFWVQKLKNKEPGMSGGYFRDNVYKAAVKALTEPAGMTAKEQAKKEAHKARMENIRGRRAA